MKAPGNLSEINAEMLLNYLYPELEDKWTTRYKGTFYRNYNRDVLSVDEEEGEVELSRDGFLKLLPQGILTQDDELKGKEFAGKYETLQKRKRLLEEAFLPFDTFAFRKQLHIERQISELLNEKLAYLLKQYFHYDLAAETNRYVKEAAVLLPYISKWRADFGFIRTLLNSLTGYDVQMITGKYSQTDNTRTWLPMVKYHLMIPGLTAENYQALTAEVFPLRNFINEWFVPFDVKCDILIKQYYQPFTLNDKLVLDYNTELNK